MKKTFLDLGMQPLANNFSKKYIPQLFRLKLKFDTNSKHSQQISAAEKTAEMDEILLNQIRKPPADLDLEMFPFGEYRDRHEVRSID